MLAWLPVALCLLQAMVGPSDIAWNPGLGGARAVQFPYVARDANGLRGPVVWDPCVYLDLPSASIDSREYRYLEARIYSSKPADLLDIYYKSPNGEWGLMGRHPIAEGWATYRVDLAGLVAHETNGSTTARHWGGSEQRIASFRIDPGNEADRWVVISSIRLSARPMADAVIREQPGSATLTSLAMPQQVSAGRPLQARARITVAVDSPPVRLGLRLMRGKVTLSDHEETISAKQGPVEVVARFPTSKYQSSGPMRVEAAAIGATMEGCRAVATTTVRNLREGRVLPPRMSVQRVAGAPTFHRDGSPLLGMAYLTAAGRYPNLHRQFGQAGIHLFMDWFGSVSSGNLGQVSPGRYDYSEFDSYFAEMLAADPEALFIPHLYVTPPDWWQKVNPGELCRFASGKTDCQSFASAKWRIEMGADLARLIRHLQSTSYADRILGYILCSGHTAEWQQWGVWGDELADYSAPSSGAFRAWLKSRYGTSQTLQAAWRDPTAELATAELPTPAERAPADGRLLRDPSREQKAVDGLQFLGDTIADSIRYFARIVKQASNGRSLAGAYFGYLTQHGMHQQDCGHLSLARLLDAPEIDFLISPPMYTGREAGGTSTFMSAAASVALHNKVWLNESDIRTHLSDPGSGFGRTASPAETHGVLLRELGEMLAHHSAISWFDMDGGWFAGQSVMSAMAAMHRLATAELRSRRPYRPGIAVIISAESAYRMRPSPLWVSASLIPVAELPRVGAPADIYLESDLLRPDMPKYRAYVFLNSGFTTPQMRAAIRRNVYRDGVSVLWCFAPGAAGPGGWSAQSMRDLTGIRYAIADHAAVQQVTVTSPASVCRELVGGPAIGASGGYSPSVWIDDPSAEALGHLADGRVGLVRKTVGGTKVYAFTGLGLPPQLLRGIAQEAGLHVYLDTNDAIDTDGEWICIHARESGPKRLRLPRAMDIRDTETGRLIAAGIRSATLRMARAQTLLLRATPATTRRQAQ